MPKTRRRSRTSKYSDRVITGVAVGFICVAALLALFSFTIFKGMLDSDASDWIAIAVNVLSSMICGMVVTKAGEGNIIKCGLVPGIIFGFIISIISLIIGYESFSIRESLKILLVSTAGSTTGSIIKLCTSNKRCHK